MQAQLLKPNTALDDVANVLLQLRPGYDLTNLKRQIKKQQNVGYQIAYVTNNNAEVLCVAGFVISEKLAWGKHIYIDDLVTSETYRSRGAGTLLINWLKDYAKKLDCQQIHLDSGVQRFPAHRFYLREHFNIASHHFSISNLDA